MAARPPKLRNVSRATHSGARPAPAGTPRSPTSRTPSRGSAPRAAGRHAERLPIYRRDPRRDRGAGRRRSVRLELGREGHRDATLEGSSGPRSETFFIDRPTEKVAPLGGGGFGVAFYDDRYEGRSLVLQLFREPPEAGSPYTPTAWDQLLQFPYDPFVAPMTGPAGLTGRAKLRTAERDGGGADEITLSCRTP